jgi:hypothetical protein
MSLFNRFRRRTLRDPVALGAFIDSQSAILSESVVQDYLRGRAGEGAAALFADASFRTALDRARWEAYPRALAMAGAIMEGMLRPHAGERTNAVSFGLTAVIVGAFDRRPVPSPIGEVDWRSARADLQRALNHLVEQRPKNAEAVVQEHSSYWLAIMPLHPKLAGDDFAALCGQLRSMLSKIEETLSHTADLPTLAQQLADSVNDAPLVPK